MAGVRSSKLTPEQRDALAESFAATLAAPEKTESEAERLGYGLDSYKHLRGRWEARGRRWADEGERPLRPGLERALAGGDAAPPRAAAPKTKAAPAGAALVPYLVTGGEMLTAGATLLLGKLMKLAPHEVAPFMQPDEEQRKRLQEAAPELAAYLDKRLGGKSEHAPVAFFALAVGAGVLTRWMMMREMRLRKAATEAPPASAAPSTPSTDPTAAPPPSAG